MTPIEWAALIGASLSALRYLGSKCPQKLKAFRVFLTGYFLAIYISGDVVYAADYYFNFEVSKGGIVFLVSFLGAECAERFIWLIKNVKVSTTWVNKDD
jgi:hypothetical protein